MMGIDLNGLILVNQANISIVLNLKIRALFGGYEVCKQII